MWPLISVRSAWLGAISPVFSRSWAESFSQRAAAAPAARLSGFTSATRSPSLSKALPISPARLARTASFSSASFWRRISSITAVFMPAAWSWAKGLPASTASSCFRSPTSTTRGMRIAAAVRSRSRACTVEAANLRRPPAPSSGTRRAFPWHPSGSAVPRQCQRCGRGNAAGFGLDPGFGSQRARGRSGWRDPDRTVAALRRELAGAGQHGGLAGAGITCTPTTRSFEDRIFFTASFWPTVRRRCAAAAPRSSSA